MATKSITYTARSKFGTVTRGSKAYEYVAAVVRSDGWSMFCRSEAAARKELSYQIGRGRDVEMVAVERGQ